MMFSLPGSEGGIMAYRRSVPVNLTDWDKGLPDFAEERQAYIREIKTLAVISGISAILFVFFVSLAMRCLS